MSFCSNNKNFQDDKRDEKNSDADLDSNHLEPWISILPTIQALEKSCRKSPEIDKFETDIDSWNKVTFGDNLNDFSLDKSSDLAQQLTNSTKEKMSLQMTVEKHSIDKNISKGKDCPTLQPNEFYKLSKTRDADGLKKPKALVASNVKEDEETTYKRLDGLAARMTEIVLKGEEADIPADFVEETVSQMDNISKNFTPPRLTQPLLPSTPRTLGEKPVRLTANFDNAKRYSQPLPDILQNRPGAQHIFYRELVEKSNFRANANVFLPEYHSNRLPSEFNMPCSPSHGYSTPVRNMSENVQDLSLNKKTLLKKLEGSEIKY